MTDDIPSLAEAMAEIRRLRAHIAELEAAHASLREDVTHLEYLMPDDPAHYTTDAEQAAIMQRGTLAKPTDDEPATITHDIPPSAPPHDE